MTEKQFETAFTAAGAWFFLTEYELIKNWKGQKDTLIDLIFKTGIDSERKGTVTRVNAIKRIIESNMAKLALEKIRNSSKIIENHSDAKELVELLLKKYHSTDKESES